jgi:hypothetical protein
MHWITRERPKVGRVGCSWLIKRFIDRDATFYFASGATLAEEAARLQATVYHVDGSLLTKQGNSASFEVTCDHYHLKESNPALALLCAIVNTADIPRGPTQQPEGPGLRATIDGLLLIEPDDHRVFDRGWEIYDAMYAYCQHKTKAANAE